MMCTLSLLFPAKTGIKVLRWEEALLSGIMRDASLYAQPIDAR